MDQRRSARQRRAGAVVAALRAAESLPDPIFAGLGVPVSRLASRFPNRVVRQWRINARIATGEWPSGHLTRVAMTSWWRNLGESLRLPQWTRERLLDSVWAEPEGLAQLFDATAGPGAVLALPHLGSWDLAGAWASASGLPVSAVAEQLSPPVFEHFRAARDRVGIRVYSQRDRAVMARLEDDLRAGRMICLVSDRDFTRHGVSVDWPTPGGPVRVTVPAGPAHLAQRTGAHLFCVTTHYASPGLRIRIRRLDTPAPGEDIGPALQGMTDGFAAEVRAHIEDWHVLQPFFPREVEDAVHAREADG